MAAARASNLLVVAVLAAGLLSLQLAFVPGPSAAPRACAQEASTLATAGAAAAVGLSEPAYARLPDEYVIFAPIVDVLPILPLFFFLLAFLWQASVGFR
mmetsp:Transcript_11086/g.8599  ORF Transcript_11086/g.8599 Transcript_11086/m.8599 type:complete len:99 (-) Transcript_11086:117-413(-)